MRKFGLIGYPLTHSFSKKYFTEKFERESIKDCSYELFEIENIANFPQILESNPTLAGLNVTIPHKKNVIPFMHSLDKSVQNVGAVNVIKIESDKLVGYNSDYYGFMESLKGFLGEELTNIKAIVLGTGGAASAVLACLSDLNINYVRVSRIASDSSISYEDLNSEGIFHSHKLIINTTPVGMYPNVNVAPNIPYTHLTPAHRLFDLVYNPLETLFLQKGKAQGARTMDGLEMLQLQAEKAWEIWNKI